MTFILFYEIENETYYPMKNKFIENDQNEISIKEMQKTPKSTSIKIKHKKLNISFRKKLILFFIGTYYIFSLSFIRVF